MNELRRLIYEDMRPALGVTEPAAIALACAKARSLSKEDVETVTVRVNSGIYKNAFTCGIPGTAEVGNDFSAALGVVCGNADKELFVLEDVTPEAVAAAKRLIKEGKVHVELTSISSELYIGAIVKTAHDTCVAELRGGHTDFCLIRRNDEILLEKPSVRKADLPSPIVGFSVAQIYDFAVKAPLEDLLFMHEAYMVNEALAEAGKNWDRCTLTASMLRQNGGAFLSADSRMSAKTLSCAAAEARVLGIDKAAMSITGSGTHGIICTLPLSAYCGVCGIETERLLRATAISYLVCMYVKEYSGKLSAFCGCGIAGGTGLACALAYLMGGDADSLERACDNMAASITGMICSGGNHCCCLKVLSAIDSAFTAAALSIDRACVGAPHGILDNSAEQTLQNVGRIAFPGMAETERVIVEIMQEKQDAADR